LDARLRFERLNTFWRANQAAVWATYDLEHMTWSKSELAMKN